MPLAVAASGPPEAAWLGLIEGLPGWPVPRGAHIVVVSPHPDDETLGVGGTLQVLVGAGARLELLAVTDGVASHPHVAELAVRRRRELRCALGRLGPHPEDGHTDHDAAGRATRAAADQVGASAWHFPVWAWHWHDPDTSRLLAGARRVPLSRAVLERKRRAAAAHASQLTEGSPPIVPSHVLRRLLRANEVLVPSCA